jgi:uncharacterized protein YqgQ
MDIQLKENFINVIKTLQESGMKITKIAKAIGYTTTRQLYNTLDGKSMLSTHGIIGLISNLNVSPQYLFFGIGEMFMTTINKKKEYTEEQICGIKDIANNVMEKKMLKSFGKIHEEHFMSCGQVEIIVDILNHE